MPNKFITILVLGCFFVSTLAAQNDQCACCTEAHRQFDFWLGQWETYKGQSDTLLGTNSIVSQQDSCVIQENWEAASGNFTGTSYNFYNTKTKTWHQTWVDNQGGNLQLKGQLEDGKMVLHSGKMRSEEGERYTNRITWTPHENGTVQQLWEISKDDGKSWMTVFDGLYKPKSSHK